LKECWMEKILQKSLGMLCIMPMHWIKDLFLWNLYSCQYWSFELCLQLQLLASHNKQTQRFVKGSKKKALSLVLPSCVTGMNSDFGGTVCVHISFKSMIYVLWAMTMWVGTFEKLKSRCAILLTKLIHVNLLNRPVSLPVLYDAPLQVCKFC